MNQEHGGTCFRLANLCVAESENTFHVPLRNMEIILAVRDTPVQAHDLISVGELRTAAPHVPSIAASTPAKQEPEMGSPKVLGRKNGLSFATIDKMSKETSS